MNNYASLCDDFGVSTYVHSKLEMPTGRETVLHFFEAVQKAFPKMTEFEKRADNEYMLEEDREAGSYRWTSLDARRLCAGGPWCVRPFAEILAPGAQGPGACDRSPSCHRAARPSKGKPAARQGRKATGLPESAQLPRPALLGGAAQGDSHHHHGAAHITS